MNIEQILEYIGKEGIGADKIYELNNKVSIISKFSNGRVYIYNNIPDYELTGPYTDIAEAENELNGYKEIWKKEEEIVERSNNRFIYEITFMLEYDVNDMEKAQAYLDEDDFTSYIKDKVSNKTANKIDNIKYMLKSTYYGDIYITVNALLDEVNQQEIKLALSDFQTNELNDGWMEQEFAKIEDNISEFKPLAQYKRLDLKE